MKQAAMIAALGAFTASLVSGGAANAQATPYLGTVMWTGATYCPRGWAEANGQLLAISQNDALFSLIGTTYGGDGVSTFGLPDLRGRVAIHTGQGPGLSSRILGQTIGTETTTLAATQLPVHSHGATTQYVMRAAAGNGATPAPAGANLADGRTSRIFTNAPSNVEMDASALSATTSVSNAGGNQPVSNMQPYLVVKACIALEGIYPSRS